MCEINLCSSCLEDNCGGRLAKVDLRELQYKKYMQVEEKELDTAKVSKAMTEINASQKAAREAQRQRCGHALFAEQSHNTVLLGST